MRKDLLRGFGTAVHRKGDALVEEREIGFVLAAVQFFGWKIQKLRVEIPVMRPGASAGKKHLVISCGDLIIGERRRHRGVVGGLCGHGHTNSLAILSALLKQLPQNWGLATVLATKTTKNVLIHQS